MNPTEIREALENVEVFGAGINSTTTLINTDSLGPIYDAARKVLGFPSPEAVEAAARTIRQTWLTNEGRKIIPEWETLSDYQREGWLSEARAALVAAATTDFGHE